MFGYELIKTSELNALRADLAKSGENVRNLTGEKFLLELRNRILADTVSGLSRKREVGQFVPKVKMFEPFKIRVTPAQSKRVQEILLKEGESWESGNKEVRHVDSPFLHLSYSGISYGFDLENFLSSPITEITYRQFMRIYSPKLKTTV